MMIVLPEAKTPSANQLVLGVFRDLLPPGVDWLWFSELLALVAPLGLNERCLRTSLFRLVQQGALLGERLGRRSAFRLAHGRAPEMTPGRARWDGQWNVIVAMGGKATLQQRSACDADLFAAGFRPLKPGVLVRPNTGRHSMEAILTAHGMSDAMLLFETARPLNLDQERLAGLVTAAWKLERHARGYRHVATRCATLLAQLERRGAVRDWDRVYPACVHLLHDWHALADSDPGLPAELLPPTWAGERARVLCERLRRCLAQGEFVGAILGAAASRPSLGSGARDCHEPVAARGG